MTDPERPSTDHPAGDHPERADGPAGLDALVGAVLDGEATPDEEARVQGDPALRARLADMRAVRTALVADRAAPRMSEEARSRLISTALAAARDSDDHESGDRTDTPTAPIPLGRSRRTRETGWLVGAAAATIALVIALVLVTTSRTSNESSDASGADAGVSAESSDSSASSTESGRSATADASPPSTTTTPAPGSAEQSGAALETSLPNLGTYPDIAALAAATRGITRDTSAAPPLSAVVSCPGELDRADVTGATALGRALVAGQSVVVGRATTNDVAIVESTCAVLPLT